MTTIDEGEQLGLFELPAPEPKTKRQTPMTRDWRPTGEQMAHWRCTLPEIDIDRQLDLFRAYWRTQGIARARWNQSFGTWLRNCRRWEIEGRLPKA